MVSEPGNGRRGAALHLLQRAERAALADCGRFARAGDVVVLMDTAVLVLCDRSWQTDFDPDVRLAYLRADAKAHGLAAQAVGQRLEGLDEAELVRLVVDCRHCLSWK